MAKINPASVLSPALQARAEQVRRFNRFYTRHLGVLDEHLLKTDFSLTQARVLFEIAHRSGPALSELRQALGLDAGYLSRIVSGLENRGLIVRTRSTTDARVSALQLTETGRTAFDASSDASQQEVAGVLATLPETGQEALTDAMRQIERLLGQPAPDPRLRAPRVGELAWVVYRQATLYAREYGWNDEFEALSAEIVAKFLREFDSARERCWIAESDGGIVGSVLVVRQDDATAKLRLLYTDPAVRGRGLGGRLVDECLGFARQAGYRRMVLWTQSVLVDACRLYAAQGFQLSEESPHRSFGKDLVAQVWCRDL